MAKILCVDTDERYGRYVFGHLKNAGHACILDKRGERVMRLVEEHGIELVLTEVMLPDICGFEICRRIRAHKDLFALPVVLMSSMSASDEIQHGLSQGADDYLAKPFDPQTLITRIADQIKIANDTAMPEPITQLLNARRMKAALQQVISRRTTFATVYIEMVALTQLTKSAGNEIRNKALRHLARTIERFGEKLASEVFRAAHMGGGHFLCLMEPEKADSFCRSLAKFWESHQENILDSEELSASTTEHRPKTLPQINLMMCVTDNIVSGARSVQEYFDVLAQLRRKAISSDSENIYFDNRRVKQ